MDYSQATADLIDRQCRNVERVNFDLDKERSEELILKTYDLFGLPRPKKIVWVADPFDEKFAWSARSAGSARSAWSAWSAGSARSARSAWSAWSAWSARSAGSAGSAWSARSALDYDFDWYVFGFEYCQNPDSGQQPNENDHLYLEYCELLMQAKEAGLGYRVEWEDTLYLAPTPLVRLDNRNNFHSENLPAIRWKGGSEFYYLTGVSFDKDLWKKVVGGKMEFKDVMGLDDMEQRMAALKMLDADKLLAGAKAELGDESKRGNQLWHIPQGLFSVEAWFLRYACPSTGRVYLSGVEPGIGKLGDADAAMAWKFGLSKAEYKALVTET